MVVLVGNLLVFAVIIIIICTVDLSTIMLDESTERLLYEAVEDSSPVEGGIPEKDSSPVESCSPAGETDDVIPDIMDFDPQAELDKMTEEAFVHTDSVPEENSFHDLKDVAMSAGFGSSDISNGQSPKVTGSIDAEALKAVWDSIGQSDASSVENDDVGMSADFDDDFNTEDVMEDIYNAR